MATHITLEKEAQGGISKFPFIKKLIPGVIASILAYLIIYFFLSFIWPWYHFREAKNLYVEGRNAYFKCDFYTAENLLKSSIEKRPKYALSHAALSQTYSLWSTYNDFLRKNSPEIQQASAIYHAIKAIQLNTEGVEGFKALMMAITFPKVLDYSIAKKIYSEAIKKSPKDPELSHSRWVLDGRKVSSEIDKKPIQDAITLKKDYVFAKIEFARALFLSEDEGSDDTALDILDENIDLFSNIAAAHSIRGAIYGRKKKMSEAEACFNKALQLDTNGGGPYNNIGNIYTLSGNFEEATRYYEKGLSLYPKSLKIVANTAYCYIEKEKFEKAIDMIEKKLTIDTQPKVLGNLYFALSVANWRIGKKEVGKYFFDKAISQNKRHADINSILPNHSVFLKTIKELIDS